MTTLIQSLPLSALRHPNYRLYWFGTFAWIMGEFFRYLAQSWLVFDLTRDPVYLGLVSVVGVAPMIVLVPFTGVLADRLDRRRILVVSQVTTGSLMSVVGFLIVSGRIEVWQIMAFAFLTGTVQAFDEPARQSLVPDLVPREDLPSAVSLGTGVWSISQVLAPALSGVILALLGAGPCYFVTATGFWTSAALLSFMRLAPRQRETGGGAMHEIREGLAYVRNNPVIRSLLAISVTIGAFGYGAFVLMPVFAQDVLDVGSVGYGAMQAVVGAGGIVGTLWAATLGYSRHRGRVLVASAATFGALMLAFGLSASFPLTLAVLAGVGFADGMFINLGMTVAQSMLPDELRGRVMGLWGVTWFVPPLGGILGGALAGSVGAPATVAGFGTVVALMAFVVGIPGVRSLRQVPGAAAAVVETEPPLPVRAG